MSVGSISYYFTLFKKFQVLNHVPEQSVHGAPASPTGNFQLNDPSSVFGGSASFPSLLGATPATSPLWQLLNAAAVGGPGPGGIPPMPLGASSMGPPSWVAFQISAPKPIVSVFSDWINAGKTNDTPSGFVNPSGGAILNVPASIAGPDNGVVSLFACSMPNDNGIRPGLVPPNYWATSLIGLVDPNSGNTATPATLNAGDEWFLVGVVGNRGTVNTGLYSSGGNTNGVECAGVVMVWNTFFGPGVELPALSNLDVNDINPIYESYNVFGAKYDVVGFRLNVQNVFNGIVAALVAQGPAGSTPTTPLQILGGLSAVDWVLAQPAHLCAKILIRPQGGAFPSVGTDTPLNNAAVAQKNLAPFEVSISDTDPNPTNVTWKNFVTGTPYFLRLPDVGLSRLRFVLRVPDDLVKLQLGIPTVTFERYFRHGPGRLHGFREIPPRTLCESPHGAKAKPFPDAVVLEYLGGEHVIEIPPLPEKYFLAMAVGIEYQQHRLRPGPIGEIDLVHHADVPRVRPGTHSYDVEDQIVGGFTLQLRAVDVTPLARRRSTTP
jgi:hypothetical protein